MMKKIAIVVLSLAAAASAAESKLTGIWNGTGGSESGQYGTVPVTAELTLLHAGNTVTGTFRMAQGMVMKISSGVVCGSKITFAVGTEKEGVLGTAVLTQNGDTLQGKVTSNQGEVYELVFTPRPTER